jgi:putative hydrolase of the HAD superfamily
MILGDKIRAVTFDVGGTLIEPFPSVGHVYSKIAGKHGVNVTPNVLNQRFADAWTVKKNFGHSMKDWSDLVDATFDGLVAVPPSKSFFPDLYNAFTKPGFWQVFDDVVPCLERLQAGGIRLAVISNWDERLKPLLDALNLTGFFETTIVSIEVGMAKPGLKIFEAAASKINLSPDKMLHIGDSAREDVEGARNAGYSALRIARGKPSVANEQLSSLHELTIGR